MSTSRGPKLPWETRAADVLAGRTRLEAVDLLDLIHEVNPTGRDRDARETAARYALKSRLQSLLVTRFPDVIEVAVEPGQPGVVSLRHRRRQRDACHAVLDTLDGEARSWVQYQLDLAAGGPASEPPPVPAALTARRPSEGQGDDDEPGGPEAALEAAVRAEGEFDFDRAKELYERAFRLDRGPASALALLRFLVDAMAADEEALGWVRELPAAARAHPGVRVLLGLAAARAGDDAGALGFVAHLEEPRAAEVLLLLARAAVARGDAAAAALRLRDAEAVDPAHPDLRAMAEQMARLRGLERAPDEAELARLLDAGSDAEALAKATAILARWPESEPARRATRTLEARRDAEAGRLLVAEAEAARRRGEGARALELFQRALGAPLASEARSAARRAKDELLAAERDREATRSASRVAAFLAPALGEEERARGLAAYAELDEPQRARVRAQVPREALSSLTWLGWMDAMSRAGSRSKGGRGEVEAALALERAVGLASTDPPAVLALLAVHERALEGVPLAQKLLGVARAAVDAERERRALEALDAAEEALASGALDRSRQLLDRLTHDLGEAGAARALALREQLAASVELQRLRKRFERARAAQHYLDARLAAEELGRRTEGAERARWQEVAASYPREVRAARRVHTFEVDGGLELARGNILPHYYPTVLACVDLGAGVVVLPTVSGAEVFLRSYALDTGRLVRCTHLLAPEQLHEPRLDLSGDRVFVTGGSQGALEVSLATGDPTRWDVFLDSPPTARRFSYAVQPVPGGRFLWVVHSSDPNECHVYDLDGERPPRAIVEGQNCHALPGFAPTRVAVQRGHNAVSLHEPSGAQAFRLDVPGDFWAVGPHPTSGWLVVVFSRRTEGRTNEPLLWAEVSPRGELLRSEVIPDAAGHPFASVACARDAGMVFLRFNAKDDTVTLLALAVEASAPGAPCLRHAYRVPLGPQRMLAQDQAGRRVFVVGEHEGGLEVVPLGSEPPELPDQGPPRTFTPPTRKLWDCTQPGGDRTTRARAHFVNSFKWVSIPEVRQRALALRAELVAQLPEPPVPDEERARREAPIRSSLLEVFWGQALSEDAVGAGELAAWLTERWPDDPEVHQASWAGLVVQRQWAELVRTLSPLDPASLPDGTRKHRHHLLAAACLAEGLVDAARLHLESGQALQGPCDLKPLEGALAALAEPLPLHDIPVDLPVQRQLLALIQAADERLAAGDPAAVIALFDRSFVWQLGERQSLARAGAAHLARPARTEEERLAKSLSLARLADPPGETRLGFQTELLPPGRCWPAARLDELASQASAWLVEARDPPAPEDR